MGSFKGIPFAAPPIGSGGGRVIVNSTGLRHGLNGLPSAEEIGVAFSKSKGITGYGPNALKQLRALSAEAIVDELNMASSQAQQSTFAGPMIDGRIVAEQFDRAYSEGTNRGLPMIAGANSMDIGFASGKTPDELFSVSGPNAGDARKRVRSTRGWLAMSLVCEWKSARML